MAQTSASITEIHCLETLPLAGREAIFPLRVRDRRQPHTRERLRRRVRSEFDEMPGLILTLAQAARLFAMQRDVCVRVLAELETEGLLYEASGDRYARRLSSGH